MNVQYDYSIVDKRNIKDFSTITYTGYKKLDVINQLEKSILDQNLEIACNWFIELHISGKTDSIWKIIFNIITKNINIENPLLPSWVWLKYKRYNMIMKKFNKGYEYESRNSQEIRNLLVDIITILVYSNKSNILNILPKVINKDFETDNILKKIISKDLKLSKNIVCDEDNNELILAINEIANLNHNGNIKDIIYWYIWIEKIEKFKKGNSIEFYCKKREIKGISKKYYNDWVWLIWKIILSSSQHDSRLHNEIIALYNIYKWKYSKSTRNQKQYIIFHAFLLLKENINWNISLINKYEYRVQACCNINQLYKLKKFNEIIDTNINLDMISHINSNLDSNLDSNLVKEDKIEYQKINEIVNTEPKISVKTQKHGKPFKIKIKDCEKERQEAKTMKKMDLFNKIVLYKLNNKKLNNNKLNSKKLDSKKLDNRKIYNNHSKYNLNDKLENQLNNNLDENLYENLDENLDNNLDDQLDIKEEYKSVKVNYK